MSESFQVRLRLSRSFEEVATELVALGIELGKLPEIQGIKIANDDSLGASNRTMINGVVAFSTSLAASAAYDVFKSTVANPSTNAGNSITNIVEVFQPSPSPTLQTAHRAGKEITQAHSNSKPGQPTHHQPRCK
jgi:hypothetical protein